MKKITYEILVWIGAEQSSRDIGYFEIVKGKPHGALEYFQDMHKQAIDDRDDGMPYISVRKYNGEDCYEYGDGGRNAGFDGEFNRLPKYVQQAIKPLVEYQKTIDYTID